MGVTGQQDRATEENLALQREHNLSVLSAQDARKNFAATDQRMVSYTQGDDKIRFLEYPLAGGNSHYVVFSINVNDESRIVKRSQIGTSGPVDNSQQARVSRGLQTTDTIAEGGAVVGGIVGAQAGAKWSAKWLKSVFGSGAPTSAAYQAGAVGTALGFAAIGTAVAAGAGYGAGKVASEEFHLTNKLQKLKASITLYSPADIRTEYNMRYDVTEDLLTDLAQQDQSGAIKDALSSAGDATKSISSVARIIASKVKTVSLLSKTAVNPKKDIMFSHVGNRQFNFNYTFAPRSAAEAKEVADIIYMFKFFAHPEVLPGYGNFLYLYPAEFDIKYMYINEDGESVENDSLNKISSCVLESIAINYAPNGSYQSLMNGEPVVTELSLSFKEIEILHQGRIQQGY